MPKSAVAARAVSIILIVSGATPSLAANRGPDRRSGEVRSAPGHEAGRSLTRSQGMARTSCPPRWPYIVLTCVA
ncbi:hypothetical protein CHKEEEPN_1408 [Methylorubrum podarium]|jgi:hypothetical protein|nr:hypothetical protein CHKEEEPN_1408 [Methylorubrum podarium]